MKNFREGGIYLAPDGKSFVASRVRSKTSNGQRILSRLGNQLCCFLFSRYDWAFHGAPEYEVAADGNLVPLKQSSKLDIDQLIDTGATAGSH